MSYKSIKDKWWEWYKNFYGEEPSSQTVLDPSSAKGEEGEIGKAIFDAYLQSQEIEKERAEGIENLGQKKEFAYQEAERVAKTQRQLSDVTYQRLLKYLPNYLASEGLNTSGHSETALLMAGNQLKEDYGKAEENRASSLKSADLFHQQGVSQLESESRERQRKLLESLVAKEEGISEDYAKKRAEEEAKKLEEERYNKEQALAQASKKESESRNLFTSIVSNLFDENGDMVFDSREEFSLYIDGLKDKLGSYYELLKEIGDGKSIDKEEEEDGWGDNPLFQTDDPILKQLYQCKTLEDYNYLKGGLTPAMWEKYEKDFENYKRLYILPGYEDLRDLPDAPKEPVIR